MMSSTPPSTKRFKPDSEVVLLGTRNVKGDGTPKNSSQPSKMMYKVIERRAPGRYSTLPLLCGNYETIAAANAAAKIAFQQRFGLPSSWASYRERSLDDGRLFINALPERCTDRKLDPAMIDIVPTHAPKCVELYEVMQTLPGPTSYHTISLHMKLLHAEKALLMWMVEKVGNGMCVLRDESGIPVAFFEGRDGSLVEKARIMKRELLE
ncbi:hypothetical protein EDC01DRAFT_637798 [Geopyxis carbonaria]|nr:hypothetical protein EDC01DRAFT_637798 [Geopyxis carbonaria]